MEAVEAVGALEVDAADVDTGTDTTGGEAAGARATVASVRAASVRDDEPTHFYILICECCGKTCGMQPDRPGRHLRCEACAGLPPPPERSPVLVALPRTRCDRDTLWNVLLAVVAVIACVTLLVVAFVVE